jgi:hypothetical protein
MKLLAHVVLVQQLTAQVSAAPILPVTAGSRAAAAVAAAYPITAAMAGMPSFCSAPTVLPRRTRSPAPFCSQRAPTSTSTRPEVRTAPA